MSLLLNIVISQMKQFRCVFFLVFHICSYFKTRKVSINTWRQNFNIPDWDFFLIGGQCQGLLYIRQSKFVCRFCEQLEFSWVPAITHALICLIFKTSCFNLCSRNEICSVIISLSSSLSPVEHFASDEEHHKMN